MFLHACVDCSLLSPYILPNNPKALILIIRVLYILNFNGALSPFDIPLPVSYCRMGINWKTLNIHDDIWRCHWPSDVEYVRDLQQDQVFICWRRLRICSAGGSICHIGEYISICILSLVVTRWRYLLTQARLSKSFNYFNRRVCFVVSCVI